MAERELEQFANDIKRHVDEKAVETQRHFDIVAEDFDSTVELIGEQYETIIEKLDSHDVRLKKIEGTLDMVKLDLEFIKNELKQKVNRDEFAVLEKRLSMLEIKFNQAK